MSVLSSARVSDLFGIALILAGAVVPSTALVDFLRTPPPDLVRQLELGATLFRVGIVGLGLLVIALVRLPGWDDRGNAEPPSASRDPYPAAWMLAAILVVATILRLYRLDAGLWLDEILTYVSYVKIPFGEIVTTYDSENQHFLFSILAHAAYLVFGDNSWSLRLPAVLFGTASIWALYLLGRQVAGAREGLLSAALMAVSYHHIWFSQNARGYTGLLFWTILSSWLLLRALEERRLRLWLWYGVAAALGIYTHMTMLFVIVGHGLIYLGTYFRRGGLSRRAWLLDLVAGFGFTGFFTFVLYALVLPQMLFGDAVNEASTVPAWKNPLWTVLQLAQGLQVSFAGGVVGLAALLVFAAGLVSYGRTAPLVAQLLIVPALICTAVVVGLGHHLWPRFYFFAMGFAVLVVVRGTMQVGALIARLPLRRPALGATLGTAFGVALVAVSSLAIPFVYRPKQDFAGALAFVESHKEPGDAVAMAGLAVLPYRSFYGVDWREVESVEALDALRGSAPRTWFVYTLSTELQAVHPELMARVQRDFELMRRFDGSVGDGAVFVYRAPGSTTAQTGAGSGDAASRSAALPCGTASEASTPCH